MHNLFKKRFFDINPLIILLKKLLIMKTIYSVILVFLVTQISYSQILNYNLNDVVNDFTVTDIHGESHNLYAYTASGKYVYIDFSFVACGPCQGFAPKFNEFYDKYGCNEGDVICISMFGLASQNDNDVDVQGFEDTYGGSFNHGPAVSMDGGAGPVDSDFNPSAYPTICLINPDNEIIELDIWPVDTIADLEATFPSDFNPSPMSCSSASTSDFAQESIFSIYPNPYDGELVSVKLINSDTAEVTIHNILGGKVFAYQMTSSKQTINTNLTTGTYFVTIQTNTGSETRKLIVN